jgi:hypothetical protein
MQVSDGSGIMTFTRDLNSNSVTTIIPVLSNKTATLQVNDGFFSVSGTVVSSFSAVPIGVWKKGIVMVSAQDTESGSNYASRIAMVSLFDGEYRVTSISFNNSNVSISSNSSNILLSNVNIESNSIYTYSITYFPLA